MLKEKIMFLVKVFTEGKKVVGKAFLSAKLRSIFGQTFSKRLLIKLS